MRPQNRLLVRLDSAGTAVVARMNHKVPAVRARPNLRAFTAKSNVTRVRAIPATPRPLRDVRTPRRCARMLPLDRVWTDGARTHTQTRPARTVVPTPNAKRLHPHLGVGKTSPACKGHVGRLLSPLVWTGRYTSSVEIPAATPWKCSQPMLGRWPQRRRYPRLSGACTAKRQRPEWMDGFTLWAEKRI